MQFFYNEFYDVEPQTVTGTAVKPPALSGLPVKEIATGVTAIILGAFLVSKMGLK